MMMVSNLRTGGLFRFVGTSRMPGYQKQRHARKLLLEQSVLNAIVFREHEKMTGTDLWVSKTEAS
jgi:hypothetical protein